MFELQLVSADDNLEAICEQMQPSQWATDNEMTSYQPDALKRFLNDPKHILLLAYSSNKIAGAALAYEMPHPDGGNYLYVHELDTHPNFRRQGIGTQLMNKLKEIAKERGCSELWLGADDDNPAAQRLYESLGPTEVEKTITYSYKL